jgi:hypothetical protein
MSQVLLILIGVVLNLVPADATSVTIPTEKVEMRFTRQGGGEWSLDGSPLQFHVNNTELTLKIGDKKQKLDLSKMAGIDKNTDWAKLKEIKLDGEPAQILRKPNGLDFVLKAAQGDKNAPRTYEVRWGQSKAK